MGEVVALPVSEPRPRSCFICVHALTAEQTYCRLFREIIDCESLAARDCDLYEEDPDKN